MPVFVEEVGVAIRVGTDHPHDRRICEPVRRQLRIRGGDGARRSRELPEVVEVRADVVRERGGGHIALPTDGRDERPHPVERAAEELSGGRTMDGAVGDEAVRDVELGLPESRSAVRRR